MLVFDTFTCAQKLKKVGFTEEQPELQIDLFRTLLENELATKQDSANVQIDIVELHKEAQQLIEHPRKETQLGQSQSIADLKRDIAESRADTLKWIAGTLLAQGTMSAGSVKLL